MTKSNIKEIITRHPIIVFAVIGLIFFSAVLISGNYAYAVNDDFTISMIANGVYGKELSHCLIYSSSALGWIIRLLNLLYNGVNWYMFIQLMLLFLASIVFAQVVNKLSNKLILGVLAQLLLLFLMYLWPIQHLTYTTTAGIVSIIGFMGICYLSDKDSLMTVSTILALSGFLYRKKSFLLTTPFIVIHIIIQVRKSENTKQELIKILKRLTILLFTIVLSLLIDVYTYRSDEWKEYLKTNDKRSELLDYKHDLMWNNDKIKDIDIDWYSNDYSMLWIWKLDNPDVYNSSNLEKVSNAATFVKNDSLQNLVAGIRNFYINTFSKFQVTMVFVLTLFLIILFREGVLVLISYLITTICVIYLLYYGRFPIRVSYILWFCLSTSLIILLFQSNINIQIVNKCIYVFLLLLIICNCPKIVMEKTNKKNNDFDLIKILRTDKNHVYVVDVLAFEPYYKQFTPLDPIDNNLMDNVVILGGWMCPSPLSKNVCLRFNQTNSLDLLGRNDNAYYVTRDDTDIDIVECYLKDHYNENICKSIFTKLDNGIVMYGFVNR